MVKIDFSHDCFFFAKFQGYKYFLKHNTIFIFQYSYKARINHKFKDLNTDPII